MDKSVAITTGPDVVAQIGLHPWLQPQTQADPARATRTLFAVNIVIRFRPGKLGEKPDTLTRRVDYYLKGGDRDYTMANPLNFRPMFSQEQLATSLPATHLREVALHAAPIVDISITVIDSATLLEDIKSAYAVDPTATRELDLCLNGTQVFAKHGIPLHVSSDRGSEFTSHFFQSLGTLLRMRLHFTSRHHPSANGQVERVNSTLEQYN